MQKKYKNLKQNATKKIKKYTERFDLVLARFETSKRRSSKSELQNFQKGLRNKYQIKLLEHRSYNNRKNLIKAVVRLKSAEHRQKKKDKNKNKNKPKKKRTFNYINNFKFNTKKLRNEHINKRDKKNKNVNDFIERLYC